MFSSGLPELFDGRLDAGAGSPDVVKNEISGGWVDSVFWVDNECLFGLNKTSLFIGTNLNGIFGTDEKRFGFAGMISGECFGYFFGMIKATSANMVGSGRQGNDDGAFGESREFVINQFG